MTQLAMIGIDVIAILLLCFGSTFGGTAAGTSSLPSSG